MCAQRNSGQPAHQSLLSTWRRFVLGYSQSALWRFWTDYADVQADLSLQWVHKHSGRKCCAPDHFIFFFILIQSLLSLLESTHEKKYLMTGHYENAYSNILKILQPKKEIFQIKNSDIFPVSAQNIDCGNSLKSPRRGSSNEYPQSMFWAKLEK